jgi:hypothetical protein
MKTFLVLTNLLFLLVGTSFGITETMISKKNEYGGQTMETTYSKNDSQFDELLRDVTSLDRNGNIVKVEYFYTAKAADTTGVSRAIIHVVNNYKIVMQENYYADNAANRLGLDKMILHYDDNEKLVKLESHYKAKSAETKGFYSATLYVESNSSRIEYLCTSGFSLESGVDRFVAFLDKDKRLTKLEYFKEGQKLLLTDEKVALIRSRITANIKELNF